MTLLYLLDMQNVDFSDMTMMMIKIKIARAIESTRRERERDTERLSKIPFRISYENCCEEFKKRFTMNLFSFVFSQVN